VVSETPSPFRRIYSLYTFDVLDPKINISVRKKKNKIVGSVLETNFLDIPIYLSFFTSFQFI
jgi:hypothetical protein